MYVFSNFRLGMSSLFIALFLFIDSGITSVNSDTIEVTASVVLGTDKEKKSGKKVSGSIRKRLSKIFKWSNYYKLSDKKFSIPDNKTKSTVLSKKASIKVSNRKEGKISVSLFSEGKMLIQKSQSLRSGSYMVLAGKSTGDSAWFIVISKSN